MSEQKKGAREKVSDGIRQGIGVLSAFKEALEETIQEARERGDLSAERAREIMKQALEKAQSAAEEAKEKLDFVTHKEFEELLRRVEALEARVAALDGQDAEAAAGPASGEADDGGGEETAGEAAAESQASDGGEATRGGDQEERETPPEG